MKVLLFLIVLTVVGCGPPTAPAIKRVPNYEVIDERYLTNFIVANYGSSSFQLTNSLPQLEENLAEFRDFMREVEEGKIRVVQGFKGNWMSSRATNDYLVFAGYNARLGLVAQFDKRTNRDPYPLVYGFWFSTNGCLVWAKTKEDLFKFDEHGKVLEYSHK
jgi:hypothetical protein